MNHIGLFEGVGGFSIAGHWAGWNTIAWCEYASFPQKVLRHHFPTADELHDVTTADFTIYRGRVDVLTGGFPCQPFSNAGQRRGTEDDRYLWPHMLRAVQECRPTWVVGENVAGITSMAFPARNVGVDVQTDIEGQTAHRAMEADGVLLHIVRELEREGYDVQCIVIPACAVNAPHRRDRIWIVGYSEHNGRAAAQERGHEPQPSEPTRPHQERQSEGADSIQPSATAHTDHRSRPEHGLCTGRPMPQNGADGHGSAAYAHSGQQPQRMHTGKRKNETQGPTRMDGGPARHGNKRIIADTSIMQCEGSEQYRSTGKAREIESQSGQFSRQVRGFWQNFPTQPPVCGGNDGLSDLLDIDALLEGKKVRKTQQKAYNEWRNKTIMAYGNAIVPEVFFELAMAINAVTPK